MMNTPQDYIKKNLPIIPCNGKAPIPKNWTEIESTEADFKPGNNIGLKMEKHIDIDIDNPLCKKFLNCYMESPSAIYGRKSNPGSHWLYKGTAEYKKFALTKHFESIYKDFPHGATLIEIRSGKQRQSIVPGSIINGEKVEWDLFEGIAPYSNDPNEDIAQVALSTALSLLFPGKGNRDEFLLTVACLLCRTKWTAAEIDKFCFNLAQQTLSESEFHNSKTSKRNYGTLARDKQKKNQRMYGFTKLKEITSINFRGLMHIFAWVGIEQPDVKLLELCDKYFYFKDTGLMYDPETGKEFPETIFNNNHLYEFPGGRNKDRAFKGLLKETEFQEKILLSKQFLPEYSFPIADVKNHKLLPDGKYFNLWSGFASEPNWSETKTIETSKGEEIFNVNDQIQFLINHYEKLLGKENWSNIAQYIAMCLKYPGQKHRWVPLIISPEGVGKGLMLRMISNMMGAKYVNENVSFADITEKHSTIVVGSLFVALNEVSIDGGQYTTKRTISAKIKPFISDDFLNINEKGKQIYKYLNNCNAMIFSNDENCLHIDTSSRRYYVCNVKISNQQIEKMATGGDFKKLWFIVKNFSDELMHYFLNVVTIEDEDVYSKRAPKTLDLLEMIEDSKHDLLQELTEAFENKTAPFDDQYFRGFISLNQLIYFIRSVWGVKHPPRKLLKNWLQDNCHPWKDGKNTRQIMMRDSRPRVYWLDNKEHRANLSELTEGELGELADKAYPAQYLEFEKLDYKMASYDGTFKSEKPVDVKWTDFLNAIPHLLKIDHVVLEEILEVKKTFKFNSLSPDINIMKLYPGKSPIEVEWILLQEHKKKISDIIENHRKRLEPKPFSL